MVAGLFGPKMTSEARVLAAGGSSPRVESSSASLCGPPPLVVAEIARSPTSVAEEIASLDALGDGWGSTTTTEEDRLEMLALERPPDGPDMRPGSLYRVIFGDIPLEDAVLTMFCQAALVNGMLLGDNKYSARIMPDSTAVEIADAAHLLGRMIQALLGPVHTTKLHRLMYHLLQELRFRGNLAEGDTSENESKHTSCKQMFRRSNKRGPTLPLQMLRAEEAQDYIVDEHRRERRAAKQAAKRATDEGGALDAEEPAVSYRGVRVTLSSVAAWSGLSALAACLGVDPAAVTRTTVTLANTVSIVATFDWGTPAQPVQQFVRGAEDFHGSPWRSHVLYMDADGTHRRGVVRVLLRRLNAEKRQAAVIQCLREVPARPGCVLTRYGCQRLAWDFASPSDEWPRLKVIEVSSIVRVEQVHVDWWDLAGRLGIRAMPSTTPDTADERHKARFFTNVFYPWVSRTMHLDSD